MTGTITNRSWRGFLLLVVLTTTGLLVSRAHTQAQGTAQQIIDDAAAALGGRDRVMAVTSMPLAARSSAFMFSPSCSAGPLSPPPVAPRGWHCATPGSAEPSSGRVRLSFQCMHWPTAILPFSPG